MHDLKYPAKNEASIIRDCIRTRQPLPKYITDAPELQIENALFYNAFHELGTCRQFGWGLGPIPYTSILQYCDINDIEGELLDDMVFMIRSLDNAYLEYMQEKNKAKSPRKARR